MVAFTALGRAKQAIDKAQRLFVAGDYREAGIGYAKALAHATPGLARPTPDHIALAASAHLGLGRVRLRLGAFGEALSEFVAAQRLQPQEWECFYWDGCARAHAGDYAGAERSFTAALRCAPESGRTHVQRAYARVRRGDDRGGLSDLIAAERYGHLDDPARLVFAYLLLRQRHPSGAVRQLGNARFADDTPAAHALLGLARAEEDRDREALDLLDRAIALGLDDDAILFRHGLAAYRLGRYVDSTRSWSRLRDRHPHRARVALFAARSAYGEALECARTSTLEVAMARVAASPGPSLPGLHDRAIAELSLHAAAQAIERHGAPGRRHAANLLAEGRKRAADDGRFAYYLGLIAALDGDPSAAALLQASPIESRGAHGRLALALCLLASGSGAQATQELTALAATGPADVAARARGALAALLMREGRWHDAIPALGSLPADNPLRVAAMPECLYRAGDREALARLRSAEASGWQALAAAESGDLEGALRIVEGLSRSSTVDRLRPELAKLLGRAALAEAAQHRWDRSAALVAQRIQLGSAASAHPYLDAMVLLLGGQRAAALAAMRAASRDDPACHRLTHGLAVMLLHSLDADGTQAEPAIGRQCIASWGALLHDSAFWSDWRAGAQRRYGTAISATQLEAARTRIQKSLQDRLRAHDLRQGDVLALLERELAAAKALAETGGLALQGSGAALVCGPLRIAELGVVDVLAERVEALDVTDPTAGYEMRIVFSQLGIAQVHLAADRPDEALVALGELRCARCRREVRHNFPSIEERVTCRPGCAGFDAANPAYAWLVDKELCLLEDATELAMEAHLRRAERAATANPINAAEAWVSWQRAIGLAEHLDLRDWTVESMVKAALGRALALERSKDLDGAIAILDAASAAALPSERGALAGRLSELLTNRAIDVAGRDPDRIDAVVADLRRAVELNPHSIWATINFSGAVQMLAERRLTDDDDPSGARTLLNEAAAQVRRTLDRNPGHPDLIEEQGRLEADLELVDLFDLMRRH